METYTGDFDEVFARRENGDVVGFIKISGKGQVMVFRVFKCLTPDENHYSICFAWVYDLCFSLYRTKLDPGSHADPIFQKMNEK